MLSGFYISVMVPSSPKNNLRTLEEIFSYIVTHDIPEQRLKNRKTKPVFFKISGFMKKSFILNISRKYKEQHD